MPKGFGSTPPLPSSRANKTRVPRVCPDTPSSSAWVLFASRRPRVGAGWMFLNMTAPPGPC